MFMELIHLPSRERIYVNMGLVLWMAREPHPEIVTDTEIKHTKLYFTDPTKLPYGYLSVEDTPEEILSRLCCTSPQS